MQVIEYSQASPGTARIVVDGTEYLVTPTRGQEATEWLPKGLQKPVLGHPQWLWVRYYENMAHMAADGEVGTVHLTHVWRKVTIGSIRASWSDDPLALDLVEIARTDDGYLLKLQDNVDDLGLFPTPEAALGAAEELFSEHDLRLWESQMSSLLADLREPTD